MHQKFSVFLTLVLLCCLFLMVMSFIQINDFTFENDDIRYHTGIIEGKIRRQQMEYDMLVEALPGMREENERLVPESEEALALEKELKAQRRALRKEIEKLEMEAALEKYRAALYHNTFLQAEIDKMD